RARHVPPADGLADRCRRCADPAACAAPADEGDGGGIAALAASVRTHEKARLAPGFFAVAQVAGATLFGFQAGHADDVVAAVDVGDFTGDARGEVRAQERGGIADVLEGGRAPDRAGGLHVAEDLAETADAGRGQGHDRAGGTRRKASAVRAVVERQAATA